MRIAPQYIKSWGLAHGVVPDTGFDKSKCADSLRRNIFRRMMWIVTYKSHVTFVITLLDVFDGNVIFPVDVERQ